MCMLLQFMLLLLPLPLMWMLQSLMLTRKMRGRGCICCFCCTICCVALHCAAAASGLLLLGLLLLLVMLLLMLETMLLELSVVVCVVCIACVECTVVAAIADCSSSCSLLGCCPLKEASGSNCLLAACLNNVDEHVVENADVPHGAASAPVALEHAGGAVANESGAARLGTKGPANLAPWSWMGFFTPR